MAGYKYLCVKPKKNLILILALVILVVTFVKFYTNNAIIPIFGQRWYPLKGYKIVVDAGHGGIDGGTHFNNQIFEKDLNLDVALKLRDTLVSQGAEVVITRESDIELGHLNNESPSRHQRDLLARLRIIEKESPHLFVSIHINSLPSHPSVRGPMVFYGSKKEHSKLLAVLIQERLNNIQFNNFQQKKNRALKRDFFLLRRAPYPGVIIELGFLSNAVDRKHLQIPEFQHVLAEAVSDGIREFLFYTYKPRV